jgi:hypothetical protein
MYRRMMAQGFSEAEAREKSTRQAIEYGLTGDFGVRKDEAGNWQIRLDYWDLDTKPAQGIKGVNKRTGLQEGLDRAKKQGLRYDRDLFSKGNEGKAAEWSAAVLGPLTNRIKAAVQKRKGMREFRRSAPPGLTIEKPFANVMPDDATDQATFKCDLDQVSVEELIAFRDRLKQAIK